MDNSLERNIRHRKPYDNKATSDVNSCPLNQDLFEMLAAYWDSWTEQK